MYILNVYEQPYYHVYSSNVIHRNGLNIIVTLFIVYFEYINIIYKIYI
jgi:hypothetical protein